jgi:Rps23 Pro-64 3,4-dihydroxylase Tpa1-like proline 4-hydroxylase
MPQVQQHREARWVVLEEFLVWEELAALMDHALTRELDFTASGVVAGADPAHRDHRRSRVLLDAGPLRGVICRRIERYLPWVVEALGRARFDVTGIEAQITASNDGDYFRIHDDNTRGCAPTREISFVYFFHREPRPFEGGELALHGGGAPKAITPEQNAIVFFPSGCLHEIRPVRCPSRRFADSRFTVNGWIHRRAPGSP